MYGHKHPQTPYQVEFGKRKRSIYLPCVPLSAGSIGFQHSAVLPTDGDEIITHWTLRLSNLQGRILISCGQAIAQESLSYAATVGTPNFYRVHLVSFPKSLPSMD